MRKPLLIHVYSTLRHGYGRLSHEAQEAVRAFVASQRTDGGFMNPGGKADDYYTQFGRLLESVFSPTRLALSLPRLTVPESKGRSDIYGRFFHFISQELRFGRPKHVDVSLDKAHLSTNSVCCMLAMQHQTGEQADASLATWLRNRQHESGGFHANELAPIPDMLSTGVSLFTCRLLGLDAAPADDFIQAHWLDNGGFAPTIMDEYSDVEYVFYGLLALGSDGR